MNDTIRVASQTRSQALELFHQAYTRSPREQLAILFTGRRRDPLPALLDQMQGRRPVSARSIGVRTVPLARICGSEGRAQDFDRDFRPLRSHLRERWTNIAWAYLNEVPLPAVQLVQIDDCYYVRDGHHRISVARCFGRIDIDAEVTLWIMSETLQMGRADCWEQEGSHVQGGKSNDGAQHGFMAANDLSTRRAPRLQTFCSAAPALGELALR